MRVMGWTWAEYDATPAHVVDRLIELVNEEHDAGDGAAMSPQERRAMGGL